MSKGLIIAAGVGLAWLGIRAAAKKQAFDLLTYGVSNIALRWNGLTPMLNFKLNIFNPNAESIPVQQVSGKIYFKNAAVATFLNQTAINIAAKSSTAVDMTVRLSLGGFVAALINKTADAQAVVDGLIRTAYFDVPIKYNWQPS
ncbi:LEA14-like dessication related protein [Lacibacter cauensis]|uniref:LEA14-like dessication related protein n=1 Tax=Lacibacter cauensis TaxID=510947 RepID=A0A562SIE4_9BACT|nr:LEA type 2 family protein [Lacibacter cauensis]TWI80536.1 LEA14-like dessication related protein [Lacibacter cauensis]